MLLSELNKKVLALIEELNPDSEYLTDDPDIAAKQEYVTTQVMFEMARYKKIPDYVEMAVNEGDLIRFADINDETEHDVYQISMVRGVNHEPKAQGTVIKILESGTAEIEYFRYPTRITDKNREKYTLELSDDVIEILPYAIAADLLKSDVSAEYGKIYEMRAKEMIQQLDPRYSMTSIYIDGGVDV